MAKIFYPNWVSSVSGAFKTVVFVKQKIFYKGQSPGGYIRARSVYKPALPSFTRDNQYRVFRVVAREWKTLTKIEAASWNNAVDSYKLDYYISGRNLFFAFFLSLYYNAYSKYFPVEAFNIPHSKQYDQRHTIGFTIANVE